MTASMSFEVDLANAPDALRRFAGTDFDQQRRGFRVSTWPAWLQDAAHLGANRELPNENIAGGI